MISNISKYGCRNNISSSPTITKLGNHIVYSPLKQNQSFKTNHSNSTRTASKPKRKNRCGSTKLRLRLLKLAELQGTVTSVLVAYPTLSFLEQSVMLARKLVKEEVQKKGQGLTLQEREVVREKVKKGTIMLGEMREGNGIVE